MASCRRCSLLRMDESNRREPTLTTRPPRISGSTRASTETLVLPSTARSESVSCWSCSGDSGTAEVTATVVSPRRLASSARERRGHGDQLAGAAVGRHRADETAGEALDAGRVENGQQRLALQRAANHRVGQQAGEVGAVADHPAECPEVFGYLIKRPGIVRQLEKSAGIAASNARYGGT